ncbi:interferon-induced protein 44 isoform X2 [Ursus maritimus]|uniref:Interferon-induced protein 44 isoform X2 n=1 Tax=Ursus maritimus TaxID=29073 RepID=A0A384C232_URSMA|nr:interferon-induced protein 44 isoform X2 [Ursus maritimus]XP_026353523.1 interferon-induced protein 44 isoform X2 [Ursus arctos]
MAVATRLTGMQEKKLQNYFGGKQFTLLYKATVHEFSGDNLLQRCCDQGPTVTVIYGGHYVLGVYIRESYKRDDRVPIVLFAVQENEISECDVGASSPSSFLYQYNRRWDDSGFLLNLEQKKVNMNLDTFKKLGLPQNQPISFEECEVFRCEDLLDERIMKGITRLQDKLLVDVRNYRPRRDLVHQIRILLLGPTGAGKSSFFNSVKSVFRGHVTHQALVGSDTTGVSDKFDSTKAITPGHSNYIDYPLLKDRIHCAAFVFDINSVEYLSRDMMAKIKKIRRELIKCGVAHVILLTHVDSMDLVTRGDLRDIYSCMPVKLKLETVHRELGFALSDILVVSNYTSEWELDPVKDVLILSALRQMLWAADDFLEDLLLEETEIKEKELSSE